MNGFPSKVSKSTPENILPALVYIFNLSLSSGKFIDAFKVAKPVVLKLGSIEPQGFGEAIAGVRPRSE